MADYHKIHSKIWTDAWFYDLDIYQQHLFIYLFSNSRATIAGIYELPLPVMAAEVKMAPEQIQSCFQVYHAAGKAFYDDGVVWVKNLRQYHETPSPQLQKGIQKELDRVKDCDLKRQYMAYYGPPEMPEFEPAAQREDETVSELPFEGIGGDLDGTDMVSVPSGDHPSLVLSSIVSSESTRAQEKPFVTEVTKRMQAIFDVCGLDARVPAHVRAVEGAAAQLDDYTGDEIRDRFEHPSGPVAGWNWYIHDFRGKKGEQPTPRWVVENISKAAPRPLPQANGQARAEIFKTLVQPYARKRLAWKGLTPEQQAVIWGVARAAFGQDGRPEDLQRQGLKDKELMIHLHQSYQEAA